MLKHLWLITKRFLPVSLYRITLLYFAFFFLLNYGAKHGTYCLNSTETNCSVDARRLALSKAGGTSSVLTPTSISDVF